MLFRPPINTIRSFSNMANSKIYRQNNILEDFSGQNHKISFRISIKHDKYLSQKDRYNGFSNSSYTYILRIKIRLPGEPSTSKHKFILQQWALQLNQRMRKRINDQEFNVDKQIKKDYTVISAKKRQKLIECVIVKQMTIYKAAKRLDIRHPTAKSIIKSYRKAHLGEFLSSKSFEGPNKEFISSYQNQNRSEMQQINQRKKSLLSSQKEHQPSQTALSPCQAPQYSYVWSPYCVYLPFSWNHY